jgi:hypothetical protein
MKSRKRSGPQSFTLAEPTAARRHHVLPTPGPGTDKANISRMTCTHKKCVLPRVDRPKFSQVGRQSL